LFGREPKWISSHLSRPSRSGVTARVLFTNNTRFNQGTHEADVDATVNIDLFVGGNAIEIPKQPVLGGAGGNPNVYFIFLDSKKPDWNPAGSVPRKMQ
jgi:hypothetical protein